MRICTEWLENWDVFDGVITENLSWTFAYDPEMQWQGWEWKTPEELRMKKARMSRSQTKAMIVTVFDCFGIILKHWVPHRQTITAAYYIEVLKTLQRAIARKQSELWANNSWLLHNNMPAHSASDGRSIDTFFWYQYLLIETLVFRFTWKIVSFPVKSENFPVKIDRFSWKNGNIFHRTQLKNPNITSEYEWKVYR